MAKPKFAMDTLPSFKMEKLKDEIAKREKIIKDNEENIKQSQKKIDNCKEEIKLIQAEITQRNFNEIIKSGKNAGFETEEETISAFKEWLSANKKQDNESESAEESVEESDATEE